MSEEEFEKTKAVLVAAQVPFEVLEHAEVKNSQEASVVRGSPLKQSLKSILITFVRSGKKSFVLVNIPADRRLDLKKVKSVLQAQEAKLSSVSDVLEQTGCELGAVPPVGHKNKLAVLVDLKVFDGPLVEFNAGLKTQSIRLKSADFRAALKKI